MNYEPKGKWFVRVTNLKTRKSGYIPYDGFRTKKEALEMIDKLNATKPHQDGTCIAVLER